jgi:hypothetical protein
MSERKWRSRRVSCIMSPRAQPAPRPPPVGAALGKAPLKNIFPVRISHWCGYGFRTENAGFPVRIPTLLSQYGLQPYLYISG